MSMTMAVFAGQEPQPDNRVSFKCEICGEYRDEAEGVFRSHDNLTCCPECKEREEIIAEQEEIERNWEETGKEI